MLKKGIPGKGGRERVESFSYVPVATGTKSYFAARLAGPVYWAMSHEHTKATPGSKPCLQWLTDGALLCPRCRPHVCPVCIGWVPMWREEDGKPVIAIVHESASDLLAGLEYPVRVLVGRCDDVSGVFVKRAESQPVFKTENDQRKRAVDITNDLLTMWGYPQLNTWLIEQKRGATCELRKSDGAEFDQMHRAAAQRYAAPAADELQAGDEYNAAMQRALRRSKEAETNGNGKYKPKG